MKIAVVILNWNGKSDTLACLESLRKMNYDNFFTVVADNGSSDDSVVTIRKQFPEVFVVENGENLGFAEGNNRAIRLALSKGADAVFLLNNDTIIDPDALSAFARNGADVQGGALYLFDEPDRFDHLGGTWNKKDFAFDLVALRDKKMPKRPIDYDYFCGAALFIKRKVLEEIGLLEPTYFLYWEESDFCYRAKQKGFSLSLCQEAKIWHKVGASVTGGKPHATYFWWRNRMLFVERNFSKAEFRTFFRKHILPEFLHVAKLCAIKSVELGFIRILNIKKNVIEKKKKLYCYRATLRGVFDYVFRHFDKGPSWIYKKIT